MLLFDVYEPLGAEELAWVGRGVAEALAGLHAAGRAHGSVDARHVDIEGPVVTLLPAPEADAAASRITYGRAVEPPSAEGDVRALGRLLRDHLALAAAQSRRPSAALRGRRGRAVSSWLLALWPGGRSPRTASSSSASGLIARLRPTRPGLLEPPPAEQALADVARLAAADEGGRPPSAASVAALISLRLPTARPPGDEPPPPESAPPRRAAAAPPPSRPRRRPRGRGNPQPVLGVLAGLAVVGSGLWLVASLAGMAWRPAGHHPPAAALPIAVAPAAVPAAAPAPGSTSTSVEGGVLTTADGRYALGRPGDVVVTGDWLCRGSPLPALLRPTSGEVYVFDRWPAPGRQVEGRAVGVVPGAVSLRAGGPSNRRCPTLIAMRPDGASPVPLPIEEGGSP